MAQILPWNSGLMLENAGRFRVRLLPSAVISPHLLR